MLLLSRCTDDVLERSQVLLLSVFSVNFAAGFQKTSLRGAKQRERRQAALLMARSHVGWNTHAWQIQAEGRPDAPGFEHPAGQPGQARLQPQVSG